MTLPPESEHARFHIWRPETTHVSLLFGDETARLLQVAIGETERGGSPFRSDAGRR